MAVNGRSEEDMLDSVTQIRVRNNDLWMGILAIALKADPETTKELIKAIAKNDAAITVEMMGIADAPDESS